jgi:two-component system LytT family sensor kinase
VFTSLHKRAWSLVRNPQVDWQVILLLAPVVLEMLRQALGRRFGANGLFYLGSDSAWMSLLVVFGTVMAVAIPIKIWNNARIEHRLIEQEKLLMHARIEALASQINPHFLFNTLTSVSSLVRTEPDTARMVIAKLSSLLRRLLRSRDHFNTLREEITSIDEYLAIEKVRFGPNLRIEKDISPDTLDVIVPSMILQPLVENSIKHGISPKVGGGRILIRSVRLDDHTIIEVEDDGLGMSDESLENALHGGIGLNNVNERLSVIYGASYRLKLSSAAGKGTCARVEIPETSISARLTA